ncbi:aminoacyl-tRNA hydrolase [Clostridium oceanicum]|uniref:Peptidyl-tRNA hydrolase n=1 Tax=Clostridium oceanicum TaxID=1543 RepID=A0ABP3V2J9_9CLOT
MYLIVGLGNIGSKYDKTRHNIGFDTIDAIAEKYNINVDREKFKGVYGQGVINGEKILLLKPSTYMNLSGESIIKAANFYKIDKKNIIVIYDDMSLDIGKLRIRGKGSSGGHNGIKSIIQNLGTDTFPRVKVGIGNPSIDVVSYVLGKFSKEERNTIDKVLQVAGDAAINIAKEGIDKSMNKFNSTKIED